MIVAGVDVIDVLVGAVIAVVVVDVDGAVVVVDPIIVVVVVEHIEALVNSTAPAEAQNKPADADTHCDAKQT